MSRINVYVPDELAARAKESGLNVSNLTQEAIRSALAADNLTTWVHRVSALESTGVEHEKVLSAVEGAKDEVEGYA
jgi:post-segregation antitoxin (ccd killing protein)